MNDIWKLILVYFVCSIIIGNFIDIYLFGLLAVLIHWFFQVIYFGWLLYSFLLYLFLHRLEIFLLVISLLEYFSSFFQSLTLSNRISINLLSGSLLIELLSVLFFFKGRKGIYSLFLNSFPYWTTYIICNDFLTLNQLNRFSRCINFNIECLINLSLF